MDSDLAGRRAARRIADDLKGHAHAQIVDLAPSRHDGYDLTDWIAERPDRAAAQLTQLTSRPIPRTASAAPRRVRPHALMTAARWPNDRAGLGLGGWSLPSVRGSLRCATAGGRSPSRASRPATRPRLAPQGLPTTALRNHLWQREPTHVADAPAAGAQPDSPHRSQLASPNDASTADTQNNHPGETNMTNQLTARLAGEPPSSVACPAPRIRAATSRSPTMTTARAPQQARVRDRLSRQRHGSDGSTSRFSQDTAPSLPARRARPGAHTRRPPRPDIHAQRADAVSLGQGRVSI